MAMFCWYTLMTGDLAELICSFAASIHVFYVPTDSDPDVQSPIHIKDGQENFTLQNLTNIHNASWHILHLVMTLLVWLVEWHWIKVDAAQETSNQLLIKVTEKAHPDPNPDLLVLISICDLIRYSSLIVNTEVRRHPLSTESMCILKLTKAKYCLCLVVLLVTF